MRGCTICQNPNLAGITAARSAGGGLRGVARQFGVSHATLARHEEKCLGKTRDTVPPEDLKLEVPDGLPDHPAAVALRELAEFHEQARGSYAEAVRAKDRRNVAALLLQLRRNLEVRARLEAALRPDDRPPAERLKDNPEWLACRRIIFKTLDRFPDAKDALRIALEGASVEP